MMLSQAPSHASFECLSVSVIVSFVWLKNGLTIVIIYTVLHYYLCSLLSLWYLTFFPWRLLCGGMFDYLLAVASSCNMYIDICFNSLQNWPCSDMDAIISEVWKREVLLSRQAPCCDSATLPSISHCSTQTFCDEYTSLMMKSSAPLESVCNAIADLVWKKLLWSRWLYITSMNQLNKDASSMAWHTSRQRAMFIHVIATVTCQCFWLSPLSPFLFPIDERVITLSNHLPISPTLCHAFQHRTVASWFA